MDGLLWLLLFGVLFFVMMRFGCGAHIMHGAHGSRDDSAAGVASQPPGKDPVCGMNVGANVGYSSSWGGMTYRFCSRDCLDKFEAAPTKFAAPAPGKA